MILPAIGRRLVAFRAFLNGQAAGGLVLMAAAAAALAIANSQFASGYFEVLHAYVGPMSVQHWINDALMAVFFLLVGLEIKREVLEGQLSRWSRRILPGIAAAGGMAVPAAIYAAFNWNDPKTLPGWAIPTATDIAFALGVLSLLGSRVPASLKVFLTALAIIDDLGAVLIIAIFYAGPLSELHLGGAFVIVAMLVTMNWLGIVRLSLYLTLGAALWFFVLQSGVHATVAGVLLAMTIPLRSSGDKVTEPEQSPLHLLERGLHNWVAFLIIPLFGFANAGISFSAVNADALSNHITLGIAFGLLAGKLLGVFGSACCVIRLGLADMPQGADTRHLIGVSLLCGIGFTMSLFIGMLAFPDAPLLQDEVKIGILIGSLSAGALGWIVLRTAERTAAAPVSSQRSIG